MILAYIHQARLREPADGKVRCLTCERRCEVAEGHVGLSVKRMLLGILAQRIGNSLLQ
jgi:hypothetical protein